MIEHFAVMIQQGLITPQTEGKKKKSETATSNTTALSMPDMVTAQMNLGETF